MAFISSKENENSQQVLTIYKLLGTMFWGLSKWLNLPASKVTSESEVAQSCPTLCFYQAPLSMGFSRQEYWSELPFPSPGDLPNPGIEPRDRTWDSRIVDRCFNHLSHQGSPLHASKVMLKILQVRLQQYMSHELRDVQASFRKGRGTRDQIANIHWVMEKAREFQKNIYFCFIDYAKAVDCVDHSELWKILKEMRIPEKSVCRSGSNS